MAMNFPGKGPLSKDEEDAIMALKKSMPEWTESLKTTDQLSWIHTELLKSFPAENPNGVWTRTWGSLKYHWPEVCRKLMQEKDSANRCYEGKLQAHRQVILNLRKEKSHLRDKLDAVTEELAILRGRLTEKNQEIEAMARTTQNEIAHLKAKVRDAEGWKIALQKDNQDLQSDKYQLEEIVRHMTEEAPLSMAMAARSRGSRERSRSPRYVREMVVSH